MGRSWRWFCATLLAGSLLSGCGIDDGTLRTLDRAQAVALAQDGEPDWTRSGTVRLPHHWDQAWPGPSGRAAYRLRFDTSPADGPLLGLYIERACNTVEVRLNGQLVHQGGRQDEPVSRQCHQPQLVPLPAAMLVPAGNVLELRLRGYAPDEVASSLAAGALSAPRVGAYAALSPEFHQRVAWSVRLPEAAGGTLVLMGGFMFLLGWFHRRQSYLAYFGALMIGWALLQSRLWVTDLPWSNRVTELCLASTASLVALAAVQFLMRYGGRRWSQLDIGLPLQCLSLIHI